MQFLEITTKLNLNLKTNASMMFEHLFHARNSTSGGVQCHNMTGHHSSYSNSHHECNHHNLTRDSFLVITVIVVAILVIGSYFIRLALFKLKKLLRTSSSCGAAQNTSENYIYFGSNSAPIRPQFGPILAPFWPYFDPILSLFRCHLGPI